MEILKLKGIIPGHILEQLTPEFLQQSEINGPLRLSNFLGQSEEESGKFTKEIENLNYSAEGLMKTWPSHFNNSNIAADYAAHYAHKPEMIANLVYANRMGNGNEVSGDGWKYRGRGDIELTGRDNYKGFEVWLNSKNMGPKINIMDYPDLVSSTYALLSAVYYFYNHGLWAICDKGVDLATVTILTHKINGGELGLKDRFNYTQTIYQALTRV